MSTGTPSPGHLLSIVLWINKHWQLSSDRHLPFFFLSTQITQKHQLHEASSYLLEKKGDIHGAFLVMLEVQYSQLLNVASLPCYAISMVACAQVGCCPCSSICFPLESIEALAFCQILINGGVCRLRTSVYFSDKSSNI